MNTDGNTTSGGTVCRQEDLLTVCTSRNVLRELQRTTTAEDKRRNYSASSAMKLKAQCVEYVPLRRSLDNVVRV